MDFKTILVACDQNDYETFALLVSAYAQTIKHMDNENIYCRELFYALATRYITNKIDFIYIKRLVTWLDISDHLNFTGEIPARFIDKLSHDEFEYLLNIQEIYDSLESETLVKILFTGKYRHARDIGHVRHLGWFVKLVRDYQMKAIIHAANHSNQFFDLVVSLIDQPEKIFAKIQFDSIAQLSTYVIRKMFSSEEMKNNPTAVKRIFYKCCRSYNLEMLQEISTTYGCFNESLLDSTVVPALKHLVSISSGASSGVNDKGFLERKSATIAFVLQFKPFQVYAHDNIPSLGFRVPKSSEDEEETEEVRAVEENTFGWDNVLTMASANLPEFEIYNNLGWAIRHASVPAIAINAPDNSVFPAAEPNIDPDDAPYRSSKKKRLKSAEPEVLEQLPFEDVDLPLEMTALDQFFTPKADYYHNRSQATSTTNIELSRQGIDNKYLGGRLPSMPYLYGTEDADEEDITLSIKHDSEYKFLKFSDLTNTREKDCMEIVCDQSLAEFDLYSNRHAAYAGALEQNTPVVFIFAGRKHEALFPQPCNKTKVILVATEDEYSGYKSLVPDLLDVLVIKSINSPTHGNYKYVLGSLNARRLAALIFSQHLNLNNCLFLDDNIKSMPYNACEINAGLNSLEFSDIYNLLQQARADYNHPVVFGAATISNRTKDDYSNTFCAKLHFWDIQALRDKNIIGNNLCFMAYPAEHSRYWGEDYLQHLMLQQFFASEGRVAFNTIDNIIIGYLRSQQNGNACLKSISRMQDLYAADVLSSIQGGDDQYLRTMAENALITLKSIIKQNVDRYNSQVRIRTDSRLLEVHAQANGVEFSPSSAAQARTTDNQFHAAWLQQISNNLPLMQQVLLPHQTNAIHAILNSTKKKVGITMSTGSGKTMLQIALSLSALHINHTKPITIITASQDLVQQFYDDFKKEWHNFSWMFPRVELSQIIKVMSGANNLSVNLLLINQTIKSHAFISIYCVDSYMRMLKNEPLTSNTKFFTRSALTLLDEYHLYSESELKAILKSCALNFHGVTYGFTATPPKHASKFSESIYEYNLSQALADKIVAPIQVNKLSVNYTREKAQSLLNTLYQRLIDTDHPNGGKLIEHKILIYLSRIDDIQKLADILQQHNINVFQLHTKNKLTETHLKEFRKFQSHCIALACGQLRVGYSDKYLDTVLYLRNGSDSLDVTQVAGRLMRTNIEKPEKIGYMLTFADAATTEFDSVTTTSVIDVPTIEEPSSPLLFRSSGSSGSSGSSSSSSSSGSSTYSNSNDEMHVTRPASMYRILTNKH